MKTIKIDKTTWKTNVEKDSLGFAREGGGRILFIFSDRKAKEIPLNFLEDHIYTAETEYEDETVVDFSFITLPSIRTKHLELTETITVEELRKELEEVPMPKGIKRPSLEEELSNETFIEIDVKKKTILCGEKKLLKNPKAIIDPFEIDHIYDY